MTHEYDGTFIVLEGIDGSGTSTQVENLQNVYGGVATYEPGSDLFEDGVRTLLAEGGYSAEAQAAAFAADRLAHVEETVIPALKEDLPVFCDRYIMSSLAYQIAAGAAEDWIHTVNQYAPQPDATVLLAVDAETGMNRLADREERDVFETLDFQERVQLEYRRIADEGLPGTRIHCVDAEQSRDAVFDDVTAAVDDLLPAH